VYGVSMIGHRIAALALSCSSCLAQFTVSVFSHSSLIWTTMPHGLGGQYFIPPEVDITAGLNIPLTGVGMSAV